MVDIGGWLLFWGFVLGKQIGGGIAILLYGSVLLLPIRNVLVVVRQERKASLLQMIFLFSLAVFALPLAVPPGQLATHVAYMVVMPAFGVLLCLAFVMTAIIVSGEHKSESRKFNCGLIPVILAALPLFYCLASFVIPFKGPIFR